MSTSKTTVIFIAASALCAYYSILPASAAVIIAQQSDGSIAGSVSTSCDNSCNNIDVGSQEFTAAVSGNLGSIKIYTSGFHTYSKNVYSNSCYLKLYELENNTLLANADNGFDGYSCAGDLTFTFNNSRPFLSAGKHYRWTYGFGMQNFSGITFAGSATDSVGGLFNVTPLTNAKFTAYATVLPPEFLGQFFNTGTAIAIPINGILDVSTVTLAAKLPAQLPDSLQLQIELEPSYVPFKGEPNFTGTFTSANSTASVTVPHLLNGGYHWAARSADAEGNASLWQPMNGTSSLPDFYVHEPSSGIMLQDATTVYSKRAQPDPCFNNGNSLSCALGPTFMDYHVATPFSLSKLTFDWSNIGVNNCDNVGYYGAVITDGPDENSKIIATSTNAAYLGCAGLGGNSGTAELNFASPTVIPAHFYLTLNAVDGALQGGSYVSASHITLYGTPFASSPIITNPTSTLPLPSDPTHSTTTASSTIKTPLVIVPGILGSRLNRSSDGKELWPDADTMILSSSDSYLDDLKLSSSGTTIPGKEINATDVIRTVSAFTSSIKMDFYKPLIDSLIAKGYREGIDLFVAPYDWRLDIASSADSITPVIQNAILHSPNGKIDILAHSMGGLVVKKYLSQLSEASTSAFMNKLIFAGTPQLGAPQMFKALEYGDDLGFHIGPLSLLAPAEIKSLTQNMPSAYALLPSRRYIATQGGYLIDNRNNDHTSLDFDHTNEFLTSNSTDARNIMLIAGADTLHTTLDYSPVNAPTVYNIVGCQNPKTVSSFVIEDNGVADIVHGAGDGTVPTNSAMNLANGYQNYFSLYSENKADHNGLVNSAQPLTLINAILQNTTSTLALAPLGMSTSTQDCLQGRSTVHNKTTIEISTHSPITINAYDEQGRHTGPAIDNDQNGTIDLEIPGSSYQTIGENSFLLLPASSTYRIIGDATATGTFTMKIKTLDEAANLLDSTTYVNVPLVSASSTATLSISSSTPAPMLTLDPHGDGTATTTIAPTAILSANSSTDVTPPTIVMPAIPEKITHGTSISFVFSATDDLSDIATTNATLDNNPIANGTIMNDLAEGTHTFEVEAIDNAGNPRRASIVFQVTASTTASTPTAAGTTVYVPPPLSGNAGAIAPRCKKKKSS